MRLHRHLAALAAAALAACASGPPPATPYDDEGPPQVQAPLAAHEAGAFEERQRERAASLERQGRLADAALVWEVLTVLNPASSDYAARLAAARRQIDSAVAERLQHAAQAQRRGELEAASQLYLSVLALQPHSAPASEALRNIERERNKRLYLGKPSRLTLVRHALVPAAQIRTDHNDLEHASILLAEGELDEAITLLERRVAASRRADEATRRLLADAYFRKSMQLPPAERIAAISLLEKSVRFDAGHVRAAARLKQLKPR